MAEIRAAQTSTIGANVETVFAYRLDFTNLPAYNPNVTNPRVVGEGEYLFDLTLPGMDEPVETPLRVLETDAPKRLVFETGPGYMAREVCTFEPAGDATAATFEITLTFPGDVDSESRELMERNTHEQVLLELDLIRKALES